MSVTNWTPEGETSQFSPDPQWLIECATQGVKENLDQCILALGDSDRQNKAIYMRLSEAQWQSSLRSLDNAQLIGMMRFFTRAEMLVSGWEAGNKSPAIAANKELRRRGERLSKDMLLWLRENSNNRYIPNGGL